MGTPEEDQLRRTDAERTPPSTKEGGSNDIDPVLETLSNIQGILTDFNEFLSNSDHNPLSLATTGIQAEIHGAAQAVVTAGIQETVAEDSSLQARKDRLISLMQGNDLAQAEEEIRALSNCETLTGGDILFTAYMAGQLFRTQGEDGAKINRAIFQRLDEVVNSDIAKNDIFKIKYHSLRAQAMAIHREWKRELKEFEVNEFEISEKKIPPDTSEYDIVQGFKHYHHDEFKEATVSLKYRVLPALIQEYQRYREQGDSHMMIACLSNMGRTLNYIAWSMIQLGKSSAMVKPFLEVYKAIAVQLKCSDDIVRADNNLVLIYLHDYEGRERDGITAEILRKEFTKSYNGYMVNRNSKGAIRAKRNLGILETQEGNWERALDHFEEAHKTIDDKQILHDRWEIENYRAQVLLNIGKKFIAEGDEEQGRILINEARTTNQDILASEKDIIHALESPQTHTRLFSAMEYAKAKVIELNIRFAEGEIDPGILQQAKLHLVQDLIHTIFLHDGYTGGHSEDMEFISEVYFEILQHTEGYEDVTPEDMKDAALLHDLGKIGTDDAILLKPAGLDERERKEMNLHVMDGSRFLDHLLPFLRDLFDIRLIEQAILEHHEQCNGHGYPKGKDITQISPFGRMVAIIDFLKALAIDRPYRKGVLVHDLLIMMASKAGLRLTLEGTADVYFEQMDPVTKQTESMDPFIAKALGGTAHTYAQTSHIRENRLFIPNCDLHNLELIQKALYELVQRSVITMDQANRIRLDMTYTKFDIAIGANRPIPLPEELKPDAFDALMHNLERPSTEPNELVQQIRENLMWMRDALQSRVAPPFKTVEALEKMHRVRELLQQIPSLSEQIPFVDSTIANLRNMLPEFDPELMRKLLIYLTMPTSKEDQTPRVVSLARTYNKRNKEITFKRIKS